MSSTPMLPRKSLESTSPVESPAPTADIAQNSPLLEDLESLELEEWSIDGICGVY